MNIIDRVKLIAGGSAIIHDWLGSGGVVVSQEQAQSRADICLKCPHNKPDSTLTESVASAIRKHLEVKNSLQLRVQGEKNLHQCEICTCALRLKAWVPIEVIKRHMNEGEPQNYPVFCWLRKESE